MGIGFRNTIFCLCAAVLLAAAPGLAARTYKWVDEIGVTHYSQSKPADRKAKELTIGSQPGIQANTQARTLSHEEDECSTLVCQAER
ncbi:MAG: DUF4124 domain-containing protein [Lysobacterales bacterium]|nr:MAG: DUF4124 domain-containing protein [Xanthomonadales bacterium]